MKLLSAFFVLASLTNHAFAEEQLLCRGPLNYALGTGEDTAVIFFDRNSSAAGAMGISLATGKCATPTRGLGADDPTKIYIDTEKSSGVRAWVTAFAPCSGNSRCVFEFQVKKEFSLRDFKLTDPHFRADSTFLRVWYPAFP